MPWVWRASGPDSGCRTLTTSCASGPSAGPGCCHPSSPADRHRLWHANARIACLETVEPIVKYFLSAGMVWYLMSWSGRCSSNLCVSLSVKLAFWYVAVSRWLFPWCYDTGQGRVATCSPVLSSQCYLEQRISQMKEQPKKVMRLQIRLPLQVMPDLIGISFLSLAFNAGPSSVGGGLGVALGLWLGRGSALSGLQGNTAGGFMFISD